MKFQELEHALSNNSGLDSFLRKSWLKIRPLRCLIYSSNFENPNVRDTPEVTVERLVREGVLTEPTRFSNKIPKQIKIKSATPRRSERSENKSKIVSIRQNKDRIISRSKATGCGKLKTQLTDQSYLTDTNYNQAVSSSYSDSESDCQVSKKKRKRSPSPPEQRSMLRISSVSSLANESHQEVKVKIEKETSGSGISVPISLSCSNNCLLRRRRLGVQVPAVPVWLDLWQRGDEPRARRPPPPQETQDSTSRDAGEGDQVW